jgi:F-type H+-transporting ATPase subunit b
LAALPFYFSNKKQKHNTMTLLASLITPSFGLLFWMLIGFGILVFILAKFAWPVITKSISQREQYIETQLAEAERIKNELASLSKKHDEMMAQTKAERDKMLADARKISEKMYDEAKVKANEEANAIIEDAKKAINFEKMKALTDVKNEIANLSIDIAEKLIRRELSDDVKQNNMIADWMKEINMN